MRYLMLNPQGEMCEYPWLANMLFQVNMLKMPLFGE
jgi:hypothetical protein